MTSSSRAKLTRLSLRARCASALLFVSACGVGHAVELASDRCSHIGLDGCDSCWTLSFAIGEAYPCGVTDRDLPYCNPSACSDQMSFVCANGTADLDVTTETVTFRSGSCVDAHHVIIR